MTVCETKNPSALKIKLDDCLNDEDKTIVKTRTYSNVRHDAKSQDWLDIAKAIIGLPVHNGLEILKQDNTILN
ncbi:DUF1659 domain-containing protein [Paraclostridium sordellii]|uniref:DUF1659 domain-containing protein n=1 Tax=Paraclostridium sordellii TaxID=1505 RepID=UPI0009BFE0D1|nr:DUF1659 domain-containing protein [Paeniclostridium sordellii]